MSSQTYTKDQLDTFLAAKAQAASLGSSASQPSSAFDPAGAAASAQAAAVQRANHTGTQTADTITDGTANKTYSATEKAKLAGIATAATANRTDSAVDTLLAAKADLVGGVVPSSQIPALALTSTFTVASQAAMLALTASQVQPGDVAVRTDGAGTFILNGTDPGQLANWVRLNAPTDSVVSVNGQQGTVVLSAANVGADASGAASTAQTFSVQRANHTGTQPASTITGLAAVATTGAYSDLTGQPTVAAQMTITSTKTGAYNAATNEIVRADATNAPFTVTLPTAPAEASRVTVKKMDSTTNAVTVATAGADVLNKPGGMTSVTLLIANQTLTLQYTAGLWVVISSDLPLSQLDARYPTSVVSASGDTTGATDLAAIQAMLTARREVTLRASDVYYVSAPGITLPNGARFTAHGATIHQVSASSTVIRTASSLPSRTATDGATTVSSAVVTSTAAAFTSADIGSKVGVVGAALTGATWYGVITAVTSTTATLSTSAVVALTNATVYVYAKNDRASNIAVRGGTYILDQAPIDGHQASATFLNSFASAFRRVDGLIIDDTTWQTPGTAGQGGKFTVSLGDVTDFKIDGTRFLSTSGDGVHVAGPASNGVITNTTGTTGDDMVVLSQGDANTPYITDTEGALSNIQTRGITSNGSWCAWKLYDLGFTQSSNRRFIASGIHLDDVTGDTQRQCVSLLQCGVDEVFISRIHARPAVSTSPMIDVVNPFMSGVSIRDVAWTGSTTPSSAGAIRLTTARGAIKISNLTYPVAPAGTNYGVYLAGNTSGTTYGPVSIDIDGVYLTNSVGGTNSTMATFHVFAVDSGASGTADVPLSIRRVKGSTTAGSVVLKNSGLKMPRILIADVVFSGTSLYSGPSSDSACAILLDSVRFTGTNLVTAQTPITVSLSSVEANTTGAAIALTAAGASPTRLKAMDFAQIGAGAQFSRSATQSVSADGKDLRFDVSILTPSDGDIVTNTNAALGCGTGPAVYSATPAKWKGLYSGTTN